MNVVSNDWINQEKAFGRWKLITDEQTGSFRLYSTTYDPKGFKNP